MGNIITAYLGPCPTATTEPRYQYDMGQVLMFAGVSLPAAYQVDFSNNPRTGDSITQIGTADEGAAIPDMFFLSGKPVYAFVVLTDGDGVTTEYRVEIPVIARPARTDEEPTPEEQTAIDQAIAALNAAVTATGEAQTAAETAQQGAEDARDAAVAAADGVDIYAQQAAQSASEAATSATNAAASESAASASAATATEARTDAQTYADAASESADNARDAAQAAADSAASITGDVAEAQTAANAAQQSATAAAQSAASAAAAATTAEGHAAAAAASETAAQTAEANAAASALAAAQSASAASTSASAAAGDATAAAGFASAAAQTLTDVNAAGAAQISDIDAEGSTQTAAVTAEGARVLASIPADYTELSGEVSDLKSAFVSDDLAFLVTVEGKYYDGTGEKTSGVLAHTDYIPVPDWATQIIATSKSYNAAGTNSYKIAPTVVWYDSSKTFIETGNTYVVKDVQNFPIPDGAKYCIVNQPRYETQNKRFIQFTSAPIVAYVGEGLDRTVLSHTSFTNMLSLLKNVSKPKTIYVNGGTYDIFAEYSAMGLTGQVPQDYQDTANYMPYNVLVPPNTHIIGLGNVTLSYMPTTSQTYVSESQMISPLNVAGTATIENISVVCKNGRYCIHDEGLGLPKYVGAVKKYKNVKCYKYTNDTGYGFAGCIGFGIDARMVFEFDGCEFNHEAPGSPSFYMHNRATYNSGAAQVGAANSARVIIKNSIIEGGAKTGVAFSLGNVTMQEAQDIKFNVENCYIRGWLRSADEGSNSTGNHGNAYEITLINCSNTQVLIRDANNPYPVRQLNPIGDVLT